MKEELSTENSLGSFSNMSYNDINTYFGDTARSLFNQRCQTMNRQSKIVASSRKERINSTYFIDKDKEVFQGNSKIKRNRSLDHPKKERKSNSITLPPLVPQKLMSQSEKKVPPNPFHVSKPLKTSSSDDLDKLPESLYKSLSHPSLDEVPNDNNSCNNNKNKRSTLFVTSSESESNLFSNEHENEENIRRKFGGSFDELSIFTVDENLEDDLMSDNSSTDSQIDLETLSEIAANGYTAECVAQPLTPRTRFISACIRL